MEHLNVDKNKVEHIIDEVYPKVKEHYGLSKYYGEFPKVKLHHNIYARLTGEEAAEGECSPHAEFERESNTIWVYWPEAKSKQWVIESLLHEYTHYLQDGTEMKRLYDEGHTYNTHPFELAAVASEQDYKLFI